MLFLRELNENHGKTIVLVTHDDVLARAADRIAFLKDGTIVKTERIRGGKR
jgi:ABC-type lipoprotein export system ATPase subunit